VAKDYDTFVMTLTDIQEGKEIELNIRDCETYEPRVVKAIVWSSKERLPEGDRLWVRLSRGQPATKEPWAMQIIEDLGDPLDRQHR
jgi:hypothetical protein